MYYRASIAGIFTLLLAATSMAAGTPIAPGADNPLRAFEGARATPATRPQSRRQPSLKETSVGTRADARAALDAIRARVRTDRPPRRSARTLSPTLVELASQSAIPASFRFDATGPRAVRGRFKATATQDFLDRNRSLFLSGNESLQPGPIHRLIGGNTIEKFDRSLGGIPLRGKQLSIFSEDGAITWLGGTLVTPQQPANFAPQLETNLAVKLALAAVDRNAEDLMGDPVVSTVIDTIGSRTRAWTFVELQFRDIASWLVFIDPLRQRVVQVLDNVQHNEVSGRGIDLLGVTRDFDAWEEEGLYYLYNPNKPANGFSIALDLERSTDLALGQLVSSVSPDAGWDPAGISAFVNLDSTYNYYLDTFGRNSIDGNGQDLIANIHYGENVANAFWTLGQMWFGDGDGSAFQNLAACLDVVAHEMTHGVIEQTANLLYQNQSGALNESFADIFATMVDRDDWLLGEDCYVPAPGFLRSLSAPGQGGQPGHMNSFLRLPTSVDNGGVHFNSGIPNRAAYLLADGLTLEGIGTSIGSAKTEQIFYRALLLLTRDADFSDARNATLMAAISLHGENSPEAAATAQAWDSVGVTATTLAQSSGGTSSIANVDGDDVMVYLYPTDDTHDRPFDPSEGYDIYSQTVPSPFAGYDGQLDLGPLNETGSPGYSRPATFSFAGLLFILYVDRFGDIFMISDLDEQITTSGGFNSIASDLTGIRIALTTTGDRVISILDIESSDEFQTYEVRGPNYTGTEELSPTVEGVDSVAFDYTGNRVIFDYYVCVPTFEAGCNTADATRFWSIGILNLADGSFDYPFPSQATEIDVGFPRFASNSNRYFAFDLIDYTHFEQNGRAVSSAYIYDTVERSFELVSRTNAGETREFSFGMPSFSGDDDYIVFQSLSDNNGEAFRVDLDNYKVVDNTRTSLSPFDVALPIMHRDAERLLTRSLHLSETVLNLGLIKSQSHGEATVTLTNDGDIQVAIEDVTVTGTLTANLFNQNVLPEETLTITLKLDVGVAGTESVASMAIAFDGDNSPLTLHVRGRADDDTDNDGLLDGNDPDDDNDGVPDVSDSFPRDPQEWQDTDFDGIGNNTDPDDDNDGIPDSLDPAPTDPNVPVSTRLTNLSSRGLVGEGDSVMIGGFVLSGDTDKTLLVRTRGPSLAAFGVSDTLADPLLQLYSGANQIGQNDNWQADVRAAEIPSALTPTLAVESALVVTLAPGAYTAILSGQGSVGVAIIEVFELDPAGARLINLSTRAEVGTGDNVLIGGVIIDGTSSRAVTLRARGPSLAAFGINNPLADPQIQLFDADGGLLDENDNWSDHAGATSLGDLTPSQAAEAAIRVTLAPGAYTAVVRGAGSTTGVGIFEVFAVD